MKKTVETKIGKKLIGRKLILSRETLRRITGGDPEPNGDPIVGSYQPSQCVYGVGGCGGASAVASQGGACAGGTSACG